MSLVPVVTEALAHISCISSMKFLSPIQLVPAAIHSTNCPHCYSMQCPCDTAQNPLYDTTDQLTSLSSGKASGQCPPRAKQWQCCYPYLQTGESETNVRDRWPCHAQQQGTGDEGVVASCPSARGYCLPCKGQKKRARTNMPICQSLQLLSLACLLKVMVAHVLCLCWLYSGKWLYFCQNGSTDGSRWHSLELL